MIKVEIVTKSGMKKNQTEEKREEDEEKTKNPNKNKYMYTIWRANEYLQQYFGTTLCEPIPTIIIAYGLYVCCNLYTESSEKVINKCACVYLTQAGLQDVS